MEKIIHDIAFEFNRRGYQIYEVGGHIRDRILHRNFDDVDLATNALPEVSKDILSKFGSVYTVGMAYGTIGLSVSGLKIDVTTFRGEVYPTESRKPNVVFGTDIVQDLARRDFTINAIAYSPISKEYVDPFHGRLDIERKIIRCVGSDARLNEDPLRMMRAIRFACQLGFDIQMDIAQPSRLNIISKERIRDEFSKIILSSEPGRGIKTLCKTKLMGHIIPEFMELRSLRQGKNHMKDAFEHSLAVLERSLVYDFGNDNLIFRLACLLHDIGKPRTFTSINNEIHFYEHQLVGGDMSKIILKSLKYDSATIERVSNLIYRHMEPIMMSIQGALTHRSVSRLIRRMSSDTYNDIEMLLSLSSCDLSSMINPRQQFVSDLRALVKEVQEILPAQKAPVNGDEIMEALNIKPSKIVGEIKEYLCDLVIDGTVKFDDKVELIRLAKEYYDNTYKR